MYFNVKKREAEKQLEQAREEVSHGKNLKLTREEVSHKKNLEQAWE
jgi:hypothetical protein